MIGRREEDAFTIGIYHRPSKFKGLDPSSCFRPAMVLYFYILPDLPSDRMTLLKELPRDPQRMV